MGLLITRTLWSINEINVTKQYEIFIDTATRKEKKLVAVGDYIAAEKIVKL